MSKERFAWTKHKIETAVSMTLDGKTLDQIAARIVSDEEFQRAKQKKVEGAQLTEFESAMLEEEEEINAANLGSRNP
jgi:hypothetical protein